MRIRFWIIFLALINMGFWLWLYANSDWDQRQPDRINKQFNADKIKILSVTEKSPITDTPLPQNNASTGVETVTVQPTINSNELAPVVIKTEGAAAPTPAPKPAPEKIADTNKTTNKDSCVRVGVFDESESKSWLHAIDKNNLDTPVKKSSQSKAERYLVVVGPFKNEKQALAEKKKLASKATLARITDQEPWFIVLGSFSQKEAAQVGQKRLIKLGIKAKLKTEGKHSFSFEFKNLSNAQTITLKKLTASFKKSFSNTCTN